MENEVVEEYQLIVESNQVRLGSAVTKVLREGFKLYGSPGIASALDNFGRPGIGYFQAVVKYGSPSSGDSSDAVSLVG